MSKTRILCRLRSSRARVWYQGDRTFLAIPLANAINTVKAGASDLLPGSAERQAFLSHAEPLLEALNGFEKDSRGRPEAGEVLELLYLLRRLRDAVDLRAILTKPDQAHLLTDLRKLSRYWESAEYLWNMATKFQMFRQVAVVPVILPPSAFEREMSPGAEYSLEDYLSKLQPGQLPLNLATLCSEFKNTPQQAQSRFNTSVKSSLKGGRIHAEIQIMAQFELHPSTLPPRVIRSRKSTCYLCNKFITLHGKYTVPRSHGTLYPDWRIPTIHAFAPLQRTLSLALVRRIREIVHNPKLALNRKVNESTVSLIRVPFVQTPVFQASSAAEDAEKPSTIVVLTESSPRLPEKEPELLLSPPPEPEPEPEPEPASKPLSEPLPTIREEETKEEETKEKETKEKETKEEETKQEETKEEETKEEETIEFQSETDTSSTTTSTAAISQSNSPVTDPESNEAVLCCIQDRKPNAKEAIRFELSAQVPHAYHLAAPSNPHANPLEVFFELVPSNTAKRKARPCKITVERVPRDDVSSSQSLTVHDAAAWTESMDIDAGLKDRIHLAVGSDILRIWIDHSEAKNN